MAYPTDMLDEARKLNAEAVNGTPLRRPSLSQLASAPAPVQTMDYSKKGAAMTVPQGSAPTDPDAPKPQAPSIFSNPNSVYAGWGGPAQAAAPRQPLPADRDPFANPAALAQVAQQAPPTNPVVAAPGGAAPIGRSLASVAAPAAPNADYGNEGRGTSASQQSLPQTAGLPEGITRIGNAYSGKGTPTDGSGTWDDIRRQSLALGLNPDTQMRDAPRAASIGTSAADRDRASFENFLTSSTLQSALESAAKSGNPRSLQSLASIAGALNQTAGQLPAQDLARDALAQRGDLEGQRLAQEGQYRQGTLANQQAELGIKGQELGLRTAGQTDTAATNAVTRQGSLADIAQKKFLSDLQQKALNDPAAAAQYRALTGKSESMPYEFGYASTKDQMGNETKVPSMRLNKATGETSPIGGPQAPTIPQGAVDMLRKDPSQAAFFDAKYGPGASSNYLQKR